jgi:predicted RND superfamily exporter protein
MRIMLRAYERQSSESKQQLISRVGELARTEFPESKVTGLFVLLTFLIESLLHDQWTDLILGTVSLVTIMTIAYRNLWMGIIALVPNVIPIMLLLGGMGWLNFRVNIGTAMISSDTMGLTIHDSIFYLSAFLRARRSGQDFPNALQHVQTEVRQPLLYSNVALVVGFLVLATSHFVPLIYFGVMVSVAIAGGLAVNLMLLPLLLKWTDRPDRTQAAVETPPKSDAT